jgi:hypothetical protein
MRDTSRYDQTHVEEDIKTGTSRLRVETSLTETFQLEGDLAVQLRPWYERKRDSITPDGVVQVVGVACPLSRRAVILRTPTASENGGRNTESCRNLARWGHCGTRLSGARTQADDDCAPHRCLSHTAKSIVCICIPLRACWLVGTIWCGTNVESIKAAVVWRTGQLHGTLHYTRHSGIMVVKSSQRDSSNRFMI